jgi:hypothetical protein
MMLSAQRDLKRKGVTDSNITENRKIVEWRVISQLQTGRVPYCVLLDIDC